jgi:hypothetical protein
MDSIVIQNYEHENHKDVKRIFASGQIEQIVKALIIGWQKPTVIGYISFFCIFGSLFSLYYGILGLIFGASIHAGSVYCMYALYVRQDIPFISKSYELSTNSQNRFFFAGPFSHFVSIRTIHEIVTCAYIHNFTVATVQKCHCE